MTKDFTGGQFPSLDGNPEAEVAQRTEPDTDGSWFRRIFTVHNRHHTRGLPADHESHLTNFGAVLQQALQQGLHPKAAPELESEQDHPSDRNSTNLTYRVQVVPSVADVHPETTVTPSNLARVLADPDALQPLPEQEVDHPTRWERAEVDKDGGGVAVQDPGAAVSETGAPATEPATGTESDPAPAPAPEHAPETVPAPTEPTAPATPAE
jgi:hypothetical protein